MVYGEVLRTAQRGLRLVSALITDHCQGRAHVSMRDPPAQGQGSRSEPFAPEAPEQHEAPVVAAECTSQNIKTSHDTDTKPPQNRLKKVISEISFTIQVDKSEIERNKSKQETPDWYRCFGSLCFLMLCASFF